MSNLNSFSDRSILPVCLFCRFKQCAGMNIEQNRNEDAMKLLLSQLRQRFGTVMLGGGKKAIEKQHGKKKLTARERLDYLLDKGRPFIEIGAFAGWEMYEEEGG